MRRQRFSNKGRYRPAKGRVEEMGVDKESEVKGDALLQGFLKLVDLAERYIKVQEANYALSVDRVRHLADIDKRNADSAEAMANAQAKGAESALTPLLADARRDGLREAAEWCHERSDSTRDAAYPTRSRRDHADGRGNAYTHCAKHLAALAAAAGKVGGG